jgi:GxxExxY protein
MLCVFFKPDFVWYGDVIVEVKALDAFAPIHEAQVINYLKITDKERAVLLNFAPPSLEYRRIVFHLKNDPVKR